MTDRSAGQDAESRPALGFPGEGLGQTSPAAPASPHGRSQRPQEPLAGRKARPLPWVSRRTRGQPGWSLRPRTQQTSGQGL